MSCVSLELQKDECVLPTLYMTQCRKVTYKGLY